MPEQTSNTEVHGAALVSGTERNLPDSRKGVRSRLGSAGKKLDLLNLQAFISHLSLLLIPVLYLSTLARTLVLGDPTEYTLVANVLGIAHPPGYAFITLVGKLFQSLIPAGSIPWRTHLLAAAGATLAAFFVFATVRTVQKEERTSVFASLVAAFAALTVATASDVWQHAIHVNPHILTAAFLAANVFFLTRWWASRRNRWLYTFAFAAGLGVTHHPLTVFSFPAYALFLLVVQPEIVRDWRTLAKMALLALLGLSVWLYFPIRSAMHPVFGPDDMDTLQGFLDHVLARGLSESLPFFGLADQPQRALVFWTLLRLQYSLPVIALALFGLAWLWRAREGCRPLVLLLALAFFGNYAFVINLRAQDIMAYLLGPFLLVGLLAGMGLWGLLAVVRRHVRNAAPTVAILVAAFFLLGPMLQVSRNLPYISLRDYDEGRAYVEAVFDAFGGSGASAVLLHDWEHMTPLWYTRFVEKRWPDPADVRPTFVSTERTWLENVYDFLGGGPVYLSGYRGEIVAAGFRLRPRGPFYQVVEPGERSVPPELTPVVAAPAGEIEVVGYELPQTVVPAGTYVPLTLAMRAPVTPTAYYVPVVQVGTPPSAITYTFTTDHHLLTTLWQPGEVIVERFDVALPHNLPGGTYPVTLYVKNLSDDALTPLRLSLGELEVTPQVRPVETAHLLANFRQRVGLVGAIAWQGVAWRGAPWTEPLAARPGETINLVLQWQSLAQAEQSYTVFVHLIDAANRPLQTLDYTPLGGAAPTHLWIPKWLPGQRLLDPYRLQIRNTLAPGTYFVEVGLYEMTSGRRLHIFDAAGNLSGDRYILGPVVVTAP